MMKEQDEAKEVNYDELIDFMVAYLLEATYKNNVELKVPFEDTPIGVMANSYCQEKEVMFNIDRVYDAVMQATLKAQAKVQNEYLKLIKPTFH